MEHSPEHQRGLTLSLTWTAGAKRKGVEISAASLLRVGAALALCAVSYQFGVWHARLEQEATATVASMAPLARVEPLSEQQIGAGAPGQPAGQSQDVITPLNVRDPSALVMGPSVGEQTPPTTPPVPRRRRR